MYMSTHLGCTWQFSPFLSLFQFSNFGDQRDAVQLKLSLVALASVQEFHRRQSHQSQEFHPKQLELLLELLAAHCPPSMIPPWRIRFPVGFYQTFGNDEFIWIHAWIHDNLWWFMMVHDDCLVEISIKKTRSSGCWWPFLRLKTLMDCGNCCNWPMAAPNFSGNNMK